MGATASGDFTSTPFPQVLAFVRKRALTGALMVKAADGGDLGWVQFLGGGATCVSFGGGRDRLGELLVIRGLINAKALASALRGMKEKSMKLGTYLVSERLVSQEDLRSAVGFQIVRRLALLFPLSAERFEFHHGRNVSPLTEEEMFPVDTAGPLPRLLAETWTEGRLDGQLQRLAGHALRVASPRPEGPLWDDEQAAEAASLEGRTFTLDGLMGSKASAPLPFRVVLYTLMLLGGVEIVDQEGGAREEASRQSRAGEGPVGAARPARAAAPAAAADPRVAEMLEEARRKIADVATGNHFTVLEVGEEADIEAVRDSFLRLAKKFHPDRVATIGDQRLEEGFLSISKKLREAFDVLTDPGKRKDHLSVLHGGTTSQEEQAIVQQVLNAEIEFQKAGIHARKKSWQLVVDMMRPVVEASPDNGDYLALLAWAQVGVAPPGTSDFVEQEAGLRRAVGLAPKSEKANLYLATLLKRMGKDREALKYFKEVNSLNPHNVDARREAMILERRLPPASPRPSQAGGGAEGDHGKDEAEGQPRSTLDKIKKILTKKL